MHNKLMGLVRGLFFAAVLLVAGFLSCLTAMRFAIRGNEVKVPNLAGRTLPEGTRILSAYALRLKVDSHRYDDRVPKDQILAQNPIADSRLKRSSQVRVVISLGAKKIPVPNVEGESLRAAQILVLQRGLTLGMVAAISSETEEKDRIAAQSPPPAAQFAQSPTMNLLVSAGKKRREYLMPDLTGHSSDEVVGGFASLGLKLGSLSYQSVAGVAKGTILKQFPLPGSKIPEGGAVDFEVVR
ncbi:MAG: PASTA domain-containing protein [Acidobacteria bacterium]|nr:PASTA domain-containing protein [Acidobacteriota bacterium]MCI0722999.1 PASTA domain-containing protein [Acidobacteriota bacterium]